MGGSGPPGPGSNPGGATIMKLSEIYALAREYKATLACVGEPSRSDPREAELVCRILTLNAESYMKFGGYGFSAGNVEDKNLDLLARNCLNISGKYGHRYFFSLPSTFLLNLIAQLIEKKGDRVAIFDPEWEGYRTRAFRNLREGRDYIVYCVTRRELESKEIDEDRFAEFVERNRIRYLFVSLPNNPTAVIYKNVGRVCSENDVSIVLDGAYISYAETPVEAERYAEITVVSLSKVLAPALRSTVVFSREDNEVMEGLLNEVKELFTSQNALLQSCITREESIELAKELVERRKKKYSFVQRKIMEVFDEYGIYYFNPDMCFYLFADVGREVKDEDVKRLIKERGVAVAPGSCFSSQESFRKCIRISTCTEIPEEKVRAVAEFFLNFNKL